MAGVRQKKHEKLDEATLNKVIGLLEAETPITKKEACEILNITYNTTRLNKILSEHKDIISYRATRKAQNKGKRATEAEIKEAVQSYLEGYNISEISKRLYRSSTFVRNIINSVGVPEKASKEAHSKVYRHRHLMLPEQCVAEEFEVGERVWSVRDNSMAIVKKELVHESTNYVEKYGSKCYQIYVVEEAEIFSPHFGYLQNVGYNAFSLACDLGSLKHLEKYGVAV